VTDAYEVVGFVRPILVGVRRRLPKAAWGKVLKQALRDAGSQLRRDDWRSDDTKLAGAGGRGEYVEGQPWIGPSLDITSSPSVSSMLAASRCRRAPEVIGGLPRALEIASAHDRFRFRRTRCATSRSVYFATAQRCPSMFRVGEPWHRSGTPRGRRTLGSHDVSVVPPPREGGSRSCSRRHECHRPGCPS
jgi:hypothetical protein